MAEPVLTPEEIKRLREKLKATMTGQPRTIEAPVIQDIPKPATLVGPPLPTNYNPDGTLKQQVEGLNPDGSYILPEPRTDRMEIAELPDVDKALKDYLDIRLEGADEETASEVRARANTIMTAPRTPGGEREFVLDYLRDALSPYLPEWALPQERMSAEDARKQKEYEEQVEKQRVADEQERIRQEALVRSGFGDLIAEEEIVRPQDTLSVGERNSGLNDAGQAAKYITTRERSDGSLTESATGYFLRLLGTAPSLIAGATTGADLASVR